MVGTQIETHAKAEVGRRRVESSRGRSSFSPHPAAFTLTELLVVITIIAILAGLITGAAINALNRAKQTAITLEMKELSRALEDFKNEYGAYPPNVFSNADPDLSDSERVLNTSTLLKMLKKVSTRSTEFPTSVGGVADTVAQNMGNNNVLTLVQNGLSPAEALVFWLQGFSQDISRPLSGSDLQVTSIDDNGTLEEDVITIDSFKPRFDFDKGRLRFSRDGVGNRRVLMIYGAGGTGPVEYQLYEYFPSNSQQPYVYFDTSRETPEQVVNNWQATEFFYANPTTGGNIYPLKQLRANAPAIADMPQNKLQFLEYVEQGKYQILHAGIDDIWGDFSNEDTGVGGTLDLTVTNGDFLPQLLAPTGPFIGDVADTLGNFMEGTLEDKQE